MNWKRESKIFVEGCVGLVRLKEIVWPGALEEVVRRPWLLVESFWPRCWIELKEAVVQAVVQLHDASLVPAPVAVVWCRKDCDHVPVVAPVVPLHHQLVCS